MCNSGAGQLIWEEGLNAEAEFINMSVYMGEQTHIYLLLSAEMLKRQNKCTSRSDLGFRNRGSEKWLTPGLWQEIYRWAWRTSSCQKARKNKAEVRQTKKLHCWVHISEPRFDRKHFQCPKQKQCKQWNIYIYIYIYTHTHICIKLMNYRGEIELISWQKNSKELYKYSHLTSIAHNIILWFVRISCSEDDLLLKSMV